MPVHALSVAERARIIAVANEPHFAATPPARIVPALAEGVHAMPLRPVLHGDNGATLKATTVLAMLHWLGIKPSYSRPRVSDDNAFAEALFRTAKYRPEFPLKGFADLDADGRCASYSGTTTSTGTAASVTSLRRSVMPGRMALCSPPATRSIEGRGTIIRGAGAGTPATGRRSVSSRSIPSVMRSPRRGRKSSFPVRSASLLSRPDLGSPKPRRAMKQMGGAEPPAATRSAPYRASMARMACTGPSPQ